MTSKEFQITDAATENDRFKAVCRDLQQLWFDERT